MQIIMCSPHSRNILMTGIESCFIIRHDRGSKRRADGLAVIALTLVQLGQRNRKVTLFYIA